MENWQVTTNDKAHAPLVVVYDDRQNQGSTISARVGSAMSQAGINCIVVEGSNQVFQPAALQQSARRDSASERQLVDYSVVIPVYNEQENIPELYRRLTEVMQDVGGSYELLFVDDGCRDRSLALLNERRANDPHVRVVCLARNFGHQPAVSAGLDHARGRAVIVMDGDLQDPPEVIPQFIAKWQEGFEVIYAIREKRKEHLLKRVAYRTFYLLLQAISKIDIPLEAGDFCLMDRRVVDAVTALPERNRFVRGLRTWVGFKQAGLAYERDARYAGSPKYTFGKLVQLAMEGLIAFSYLPLRLSTMLGFGVSGLSLLTAAYYVTKRLTSGIRPAGFTTLIVALLFLGGIQLITIGVIGEYLAQVLDEVKHRPTYVVRQVLEREHGEVRTAPRNTETAQAHHPLSQEWAAAHSAGS